MAREPCADIWAFGSVVEPFQTRPGSLGGHWQRPGRTLWDALGHLEGCLEPAGGCSETFLETSGALQDALGRFWRLPKHSRTPWNNFKLTTKLSESSRKRCIDETTVFCDPGSVQEAPGRHSWRLPGCTRTLWDTPGGLRDALGRCGTLLEASTGVQDGPGRPKHYACSVFCGSRMLPGRPRTLKRYACSVFCGPGRTMGASNAGSRWLAGPHQIVFFSFFSLSNEFSF